MLRRWLSHSAYGNSFLIGLESHVWDKTYDNDFLAIPKSDGDMEKDNLLQFLRGPIVELYHTLLGRFYKV